MKKALIIIAVSIMFISCKQMNTCQCVSEDGQVFDNITYYEKESVASDLCNQETLESNWNECYLLD